MPKRIRVSRFLMLTIGISGVVGIMVLAYGGATIPIVAQGNPTPTPLSMITENAAWTPLVRTVDGVPMALVPPGCFMMGSEGGEANEKPAHRVCVEQSFWIDQMEVSSAQFQAAGGNATDTTPAKGADHPRTGVTWTEAFTFCTLRGGRLPTEAEWEYAARGVDGWLYPWGNEFEPANAAFGQGGEEQSAPMGSHPGGISWVGTYDQSGNAAEWVNTIYNPTRFPYPYRYDDGREQYDAAPKEVKRVVRGGSYADAPNHLRATYRDGVSERETAPTLGFRCARDDAEKANNPATAARYFFDYAFKGDSKALDYVCTPYLDEGRALLENFGAVGRMADAFDLSKLTFTITAQTETAADVVLGGTLIVTVAKESFEQDFSNQPPIPLIKEGGVWKVCSKRE
ncbi:MAG TPA: SUMF1/EgtB/PvdO family nonheme iron enzyme [Aggregatilineales bacterium]|nr:SUMF1/EgtB/PvdO family nonheme iron enzyme [Anaerolineales bacterium]HRE47173.1 SUMF1/EgtB/PvdO family nonheme iron enzyme [Aggregatilineales bacterium]